ncbi:MAG: hypothetical protein JWP94_2061 [Mucilaginibacter sp.]|jgi:hypothetical protein|nr:hypothetical protein [Mucilaginibacter sp.]
MKSMEFTTTEREMMNFDFNKLAAKSQTAKANIAKAATAADVKSAICDVWSNVSDVVKKFEYLPIIGKYITILADVLDSICAAG